jgi:hypothetical protein
MQTGLIGRSAAAPASMLRDAAAEPVWGEAPSTEPIRQDLGRIATATIDQVIAGRDHARLWTEALVALGFVALALLLRAPALLYSVINFDESLYLLIGDELRRGILPFTQLCDRKPFGLFALFALFASAPVDAIVASRLGASLVVGLTGYLLRRVAGLLFDDRPRLIGSAAGLAYVVFCLADGGLASNAELFLNLLATLSLLFVLQAIRSFERPRFGLMLAAGLFLGLGLQIKQTILFDMLALLAGFYLLTISQLGQLGPHIRATAPGLAVFGLASALPTLAVILLYTATGHWSDWAWANIAAQRGFVDDPAQPLAWHPAFWAMVEQAPLWFGLLLVTGASRWLARDNMEARAIAFLLAWVGAVLLGQLFLRIAADHYFLQFLPALCLLNGLVLGRGLLAHVTGALARVGVLAALVGLTIFAVAKNPIVNALYVAHDRYLQGESWAGDVPRQAAADLKPLLQPGDALYAVGFLPVIYHLTGAEIPTRFAFTGLPHRSYAGRDGCPWVTQEAELQRILDTRPRFIFVEQGVFYAQLTAPVRALLDEHLARAYRLLKSYPGHGIHGLYPFERFVMNGAASAKLYELSAPALQ